MLSCDGDDRLKARLFEAKNLVLNAEAKVRLGFRLGQRSFAAYAEEALEEVLQAVNLAKELAIQGGVNFVVTNKEIYSKIYSGTDKVCSGIKLGIERFFKQATGFLRKRTKQAIGAQELIIYIEQVEKSRDELRQAIDGLSDSVITIQQNTIFLKPPSV